MQDLKKKTLSDLVDMLNSHTASYMSMLRNGADRELFERYREEIREMQAEIELRKTDQRHRNNAEDTGTSISFMQSA